MQLPFNEAKAAQTAARLLKNRGGKMSYMKLIKLLYLVDREALRRWGRPVTTDSYVAMDQGPVLSTTLNLINHGPAPERKSPWSELISERDGYDVRLQTEDPLDDELSRAEEELIDEIFSQFGNMGRWQLVDHLHTLPEWEDPKGGSLQISYEDIFRALGKDDQEIGELEGELESVSSVDRLCV